MKLADADVLAGVRPSEYWSEELSNIDYLLEASPLIVNKLRHHAFHITGIRPYDYRSQTDSKRDAFVHRLHALIELGGQELVVPENEALGGFGYRLSEGLFNVDTIKFLEVLVGMKRAGLLDVLHNSNSRPSILEIGAGWGGLAYQIKALFPKVRYTIIDFPELFLFSATYLKVAYPGARVVVLDAETDRDAVQDADFVFIPHTLASQVSCCAPDITLNVASFQEMTSEQVSAYGTLAYDAGCPMLYSLNRERSRYNAQLTSVTERLQPYYELQNVEVLDTDYTAATKKLSVKTKARSARTPKGEDFSYRHLVGKRRDRLGKNSFRIGIGATLYNRASYLKKAIDSLLSQTYADFHLVLVDDGSTDGTQGIAEAYAAQDSRVSYIRHEERLGMTATWRHVFEAATVSPSVEYFAWASDHDVWDSQWLMKLVNVLDHNPSAVLAYPYTRRIDQQGQLLEKPPRPFAIIGMPDVEERWKFMCSEVVASGDMVYGLARVEAMKKAGVFRDVLCPDRLLMAELSLQGEFRQVAEDLWYRRQFNEASVTRQRSSLFGKRAPAGRLLPPWLQHTLSLWGVYVRSESDPLRRQTARRRIVRYCVVYALKHHKKMSTYRYVGSGFRAARWIWKRTKHYVLLGVYYALVYTRRGYHRTVYEVLMFTRRIGLR